MVVVVAAGIDLGKMLGEGLQSQQAAGDALVVAEEKEVHASQEADRNLKLGATEADKRARSHIESGGKRMGRRGKKRKRGRWQKKDAAGGVAYVRQQQAELRCTKTLVLYDVSRRSSKPSPRRCRGCKCFNYLYGSTLQSIFSIFLSNVEHEVRFPETII